MSNEDEELFSLADFFQDQTDRMKAMRIDMVELAAVWIKGKLRVADGDLISIDDDGNITKDGDHATHKCIGCYGTIADTRHEIVVLDLITNIPKTIEL